MHKRCWVRACWAMLVLLMAASAEAVPMVNESARQIPVAAQVDVVVVGGGSGAVAAATAAAESGAQVFLVAPYPYLGDDMTATLRLWLEEGEVPKTALAKAVFADPVQDRNVLDPKRIAFRYETDVPSAGVHKDSDPPGVLTDGRWSEATSQSVQYNGNVGILADLGKAQRIQSVRVRAFRRASGVASNDFDVKRVTVYAGDERENLKQVAMINNEHPSGDLVVLQKETETQARFVRFVVEKADNVARVLLGEIEILAPSPEVPAVSPVKYRPPRPLHVKKVLDDALLAAGVRYLYSCYATDVLRDATGNPCGIVMANRAGRQAVIAKTIIDATDRARVARMAGAKFRDYPAGLHTFERVVIGGEASRGADMSSRTILPPFFGPALEPTRDSTGEYQIHQYILRLPMQDDKCGSWAKAEQEARTKTYHQQQQFTSDQLFEVPPDPMHAKQSVAGVWQGVASLPLEAFQPARGSRLYVLGGCGDISREQAAKLLRPVALMEFGERVGRAAAAEAKSVAEPSGMRLPGQPVAEPARAGDVRESLAGVRATEKTTTIAQEARGLPVLGEYDVLVIGGGTSGAPAGIAAARQGAKTLVAEYLHGLGGVGTAGAISKYYWGNRTGFSATVGGGTSWEIEAKMEWWRSNLLQAGAEVWMGAIGCGALVHEGRVVGAVLATPQGRGVVLAKAVIDATGNADLAASAGVPCLYTDGSEFGMQGTGLPPRQLGASYTNTDFTITDETDMVDIWHVFVYAKNKYPEAFDQGQLIDTRERRRIVGDFTITILDQMNGRTYSDTVVRMHSDFDTHGYTVDPYLLLEHPEHARGFHVDVPYRSMLPRAVEGMLVVGLGLSAHRDAVPLIRMQADIQNGGYAAGVAAAMSAKQNTLLRHIDVRELQKHLVEIGNLPAAVLSDRDSYPLPGERIAAAVESIRDGHSGAAVILAHAEQALPLLKKAYASSDGKDRAAYARVLAVLGDASGLEELLAEIHSVDRWDPGWNYRGMGQYGSPLSPLDHLVMMVGRAGDRRAVPAILEKAKLLSAEDEFSHHRAVGMALEMLGDKDAAPMLAELLKKPGMSGHAHTSMSIAQQRETPGDTNTVESRRESLRELLLARALYRCGDHEGLGEQILRAYTRDLRGHLARHAQAVLDLGQR